MSIFPVYFWIKVVIAPTASPGFLGTARVLKSKSSAEDIPKRSGKDFKEKGLVSWKTVIHFLPPYFHFLASPLICKRVCTSPWP